VRKLVLALSVAALSASFAPPAAAHHSWSNFHWARKTNPFTVRLGDNVAPAWDRYLRTAASDWSADTAGNPLNARVVVGRTTPKQCRPTKGRVEVCSAAYGNNGWLGVARVWLTPAHHITKAVTKMNATYFSLPKYNTPAWRAAVLCQEIGHTFGLDHQDESGADLHTCMDYATNPDADNMHPNRHDYEQLAIIYRHLDSSSTIASATATSAGSKRVVHTTRVDRSTIVKRYADGSMRVTYIVWAS
jgi:hypothetical protein